MNIERFLNIAIGLDQAGLIWRPEVGDEVSDRRDPENISILVNPNQAKAEELRSIYLWLPTLEQMVFQLEARQAILFHAGLELTTEAMRYKAVLQSPVGPIESEAESLRTAIGISLLELVKANKKSCH